MLEEEKAWKRKASFEYNETAAEMNARRSRTKLVSEPFFYSKMFNPRWPHIHDEFTFELRVDGVLPYIVVASRGIRYSVVPAPAVTFRKGKCTRLLVRSRRESQCPKLSSHEEPFTTVCGSTRDG